MQKPKPLSIGSVTKLAYRRGFRDGVLVTTAIVVAVAAFTLLSCAAHAVAQSPSIVAVSEPAASGRLRLEVDGVSGWWWPSPKALEMLRVIEAETQYRVTLVPALEAKLEVREWQLLTMRDATKVGTDLVVTLEEGNARRDERIADLETKLVKKSHHMAIGAGLGSGAVLIVGLVAALLL